MLASAEPEPDSREDARAGESATYFFRDPPLLIDRTKVLLKGLRSDEVTRR